MISNIDISTSSKYYLKGIRWLENEIKFNEDKLRNNIDEIKKSNLDNLLKTNKLKKLEKKLKLKYWGFEILPIYILYKSGSDIIEDFLSVASNKQFWDDISSYLYEHYHWLWFLDKLGLGENKFFLRELYDLIKTQSVEGYIWSDDMDHSAPLRVFVSKCRDSKPLANAINYWLKNWEKSHNISAISVGILALSELDHRIYSSVINKQINYIINMQAEDGHWEWSEQYPNSYFNYFETCYAIWSICRVKGMSDSSVKKSIDWIKKRQLKNGSWDNNINSTTYSLMALLFAGEGPKISIETLNYEKLKMQQEIIRQNPVFLHTSPIFKESSHVKGIYDKIYEMLHNARNDIRIISPFIDILYEEIININKNNENITIKIITRYKKDIKGFRERIAKNVIDLLNKATKENVVQSDVIHSRLIIIDENELLVSSADLTRDQLYDEYNSGIWTRDKEAIIKAIEFFEHIYQQLKTDL